MNRRLAAVFLVVVALAAVATVGVAAQSGGAAGNTTSGDYSLTELQNGGKVIEDGPSSQRFLSQYGSATIRHEPVGPLQSNWEYLSRGTTIHADKVTLRTVRLAPPSEIDRTLNVTVVAWDRGERTVVEGNQTVERPAAVNQTILRQQITLGRGYDNATISLPSNYDKTKTITMWVEEYPDARWMFEHRSVPSTQSVDVDTLGEAWRYTTTTAVIPGAIGILIGILGALGTRKRTTSGPRMGLTIWTILGAFFLFGVLSAAYFQIAVVLTYFPWLMAAPLAIIAYGGGLWLAGSPSKIGFCRVELFDARLGPGERQLEDTDDLGDGPDPVPDGGVLTNGDAEATDTDEQPATGPGSGLSEIKEVRYWDLEELPAMKRPDGKIGVPKRGIRPFLARLFADAATLDKSDLVTKIAVDKGRLDEVILVDPESEETVSHDPAHLERRWPVIHSLDDDASASTKLTKFAGMLLIVAGLPAAGWMIAGQAGVPALGAALGFLPAIVTGHVARDGDVDYEPATQHFRRAQATLVDLQREQADGKTLEDYRLMAWEERSRTAKEAVDLSEQRDRTLTEEMLSEQSGYDLVDPDRDDGEDPSPDAGGESDD